MSVMVFLIWVSPFPPIGFLDFGVCFSDGGLFCVVGICGAWFRVWFWGYPRVWVCTRCHGGRGQQQIGGLRWSKVAVLFLPR
uniref:Uncharacterized protein n=1 Tax=Cannabis sativa TaxID=3483 RepID=A0A803NMU9_CANSA